MDINITLFAQAVMFAAFIWLTATLVWPQLTRAIEARQSQIVQGLAAAERGKQELEQSTVRTAEMVREARKQAQEILAQAESRGAQLIEEAKTAGGEEGARLVAGARAEIELEVSRAREELRSQVASLAVAMAEQILRREVNAETHADLLASGRAQL